MLIYFQPSDETILKNTGEHTTCVFHHLLWMEPFFRICSLFLSLCILETLQSINGFVCIAHKNHLNERSFRYSTYFIQRLLILFHIIFGFFFVYRTIMHVRALKCFFCLIFAVISMLIECRAHAIISVHLLYFKAKANDLRLIDWLKPLLLKWPWCCYSLVLSRKRAKNVWIIK